MDDERPEPPPIGDDSAELDEPEPAAEIAAPSPASADPRTTIAGRYTVDLQTPPENAGIAVTYYGRDLRTRDPVLVKTLRLEYRGDPEMRARFRREARLLQFLSHPNVIRALNFSEERGAPWLVLERVPGRSLREAIAIGAPFSPEDVVPLLNGVAAALDHLHARGLVHLDVRPENVVVTPIGEPKLVDFGVAQTAGSPPALADAGGTEEIAYLAPEQLRGEPVTTATDVYALGGIVYELLTGVPPFASDAAPANRNAAIRSRLERSPRPPTTVRGDGALPAWVDDVVLGALEEHPRQRYGSAGSFAAVFRSGVEGEVDVETGRPHMPVAEARPRHVPVNEPGIAVKGSPRLAARRSEPEEEAEVVDAAYAPLTTPHPVAYRTSRHLALGSLDVNTLVRRLWQAVVVVAVLNLLLMAALLTTRGELPGIWPGTAEIGPGTTVRVSGTGLVARGAPDSGAEIVADLPDGGAVRVSGEAVTGEGGRWWPVTVETSSGPVEGFVPEAWIQES